MSQHTRFSTLSSSSSLSLSSTLVVSSSLPDRLSGLLPIKKPGLKLDLTPCSLFPDVDKRMMTGKGFIEPHRNNLPRRKRRVVTAIPDDAAIIDRGIEKKFSQTLLLPGTSEAGPRSSSSLKIDLLSSDATTAPSLQTDDGSLPSSPSIDITNITEPTSSLRSSPSTSSSSLPQEFSALRSPPTTFVGFPITVPQTPKRAPWEDASLRSPPLLITPTKGHLQPTCATLPRRPRCLGLSAAREQEQKARRSIGEQQQTVPTAVRVQSQNTSSGQRIGQTRADADVEDLTGHVANSESQKKMRRKQSVCAQELSNGITLGFLEEGDELDENIIRIKVYYYDDSTIPLHSPSSSSSESESNLLLFLPTNPLSYTDGTTSLTDHQIRRACTFIDEHISPISINNGNTRPGRKASVLILTPRIRPEDAMSIGVSYLAGTMDKEEAMKGR